MLVLSRKENESIAIGSDIEIKVVRISGGQVRIGISAPRYVPVWRKEMLAGLSDEIVCGGTKTMAAAAV